MLVTDWMREAGMTDWLSPQTLVAAGLVAGGFAAGLLSARLVRGVLKRKLTGEPTAQQAVLSSAGWISMVWWGAAGGFAATNVLPLRPAIFDLAGKALLLTAVAVTTFAGARLATGLIWIQQSHMRSFPSTSILAIVAKVAVFALGLVTVLQILGISIVPLLTAVGVGGLAVALALQDTLSNLFAGLHILASKKVTPGDYVSLDTDQHGYVLDINWRNATIRELPNNVIMVPNSKLASAIVVNYSRPVEELAIPLDVGVSYESELGLVERVTVEVASEVMSEVPGGVPQFEPFIRFHTFGEYSICFTVILRARQFVDQYLVKHEFVKRLQRRYREEGIQIPFPIRTVVDKREAAEPFLPAAL